MLHFSELVAKTGLSVGELALLSKFAKGSSLDWWTIKGHVLPRKKNPIKVCNDFIKKGLLVPPDLEYRLNKFTTIKIIKEFLSARDVKGRGNKPELIETLKQTYSEKEIVAMIDTGPFYVCSHEGQLILDEFFRAREATIKASYDCLADGNNKKAMELYTNYMKNAEPGAGMNIDWSNYDTRRDLYILDVIQNETPRYLESYKQDKVNALRSYAKLEWVWSEQRLKNMGIIPDDKESLKIINALINFGVNRYELFELRRIGLGRLTIKTSNANDDHVCSACKELSDKKFTDILSVPELPLLECTCEFGCRCMYQAFLLGHSHETD